MNTPTSHQKLAFALFRLTMGVNIFLHGAIRIWAGPGLFVEGVASSFDKTPLPMWLVTATLWLIPPWELLVGVCLVLGFRTRDALVAGSLLMTVLVAGTALKSDWPTLGLQMVYCLCYYLLLAHLDRDAYGWSARAKSS